MSTNNQKIPRYLLPTISSATRSSITDEDNRIVRNKQRKQEAKLSRETATLTRTSLDREIEERKTCMHDTSKPVANDRLHEKKIDRSTKITSKPPRGPTKTDRKSTKSTTEASDKTSTFNVNLTSGGSDITSSDTCTASYKDNTGSSHDLPVDKMSRLKYTGVIDTTERLDRNKSSQSLRLSESRFRRSTSNELDYSSLQKKEGDDYYFPRDRSPDSLQYETTKLTPGRISYQVSNLDLFY